jgi:hypothetical protein
MTLEYSDTKLWPDYGYITMSLHGRRAERIKNRRKNTWDRVKDKGRKKNLLNLVHGRCNELARSTPRGPKIHQNRDFGFHHYFLKFFLASNTQRLASRSINPNSLLHS